jgi:hypothetical protein
MKETSEKKNLEMDNRLANFTDQVLARKSEQTESQVDDELRHLEETILRLKRAIPHHTQLDEATVKRMQANFKARLRFEGEKTKLTLWQKWFGSRQPHPQIAFAASVLGILVFALFIAPHLTQTGSSMTAVANTPSPFVLIVTVLAGAILLILWINHRK